MCKWSKWGDTRIDPCMKEVIKNLKEQKIQTVACCCGHGKYSMTILIRVFPFKSFVLELFSGKQIQRKRRFYKRDKQGYYYIPEVRKSQMEVRNR